MSRRSAFVLLFCLVLALFGYVAMTAVPVAAAVPQARPACIKTGRTSWSCDTQQDLVILDAGSWQNAFFVSTPFTALQSHEQMDVTALVRFRNAPTADASLPGSVELIRLDGQYENGVFTGFNGDASDTVLIGTSGNWLDSGANLVQCTAIGQTMCVQTFCERPCQISMSVSYDVNLAGLTVTYAGPADSGDSAVDAADAADSGPAVCEGGSCPTITAIYPAFVQAGMTQYIVGTGLSSATVEWDTQGGNIAVTPIANTSTLVTYIVPNDDTMYPNGGCTAGAAVRMVHAVLVGGMLTYAPGTRIAGGYYEPSATAGITMVTSFDPTVPEYTDAGSYGAAIVNSVAPGNGDCVALWNSGAFTPVITATGFGAGVPGFTFPSAGNRYCSGALTDGGILNLPQPFALAWGGNTSGTPNPYLVDVTVNTSRVYIDVPSAGQVYQASAGSNITCATDGGVGSQVNTAGLFAANGTKSFCSQNRQNVGAQSAGTNGYTEPVRFGLAVSGSNSYGGSVSGGAFAGPMIWSSLSGASVPDGGGIPTALQCMSSTVEDYVGAP